MLGQTFLRKLVPLTLHLPGHLSGVFENFNVYKLTIRRCERGVLEMDTMYNFSLECVWGGGVTTQFQFKVFVCVCVQEGGEGYTM